VGRAAGLLFCPFIPEEETNEVKGFKAGTNKPRASFRHFTRFSPAGPTEEEMKQGITVI
jgi:hypothetical protein